ncbi:MAG: PIG-L deacetylase family protein [Nocardioidaceae bacterium]
MSTPTAAPASLVDDAEVQRVLIVTAHPDDADFGSAGIVAAWTDAGIEVVYCVCTDGQAGGFDEQTPREQIADIRRTEQRAAAEIVGVRDVRFLGGMDGELEVTRQLVSDIAAVIRDVRPDRAVIQSPEREWQRIYRSHPDHLAAGEAAIQAIYPAARNAFAVPELLQQGLQPWTVRETWLAGHPTTNHAVDITASFDRKVRAILAHRSQHPDPDTIDARMRGFATATAQAYGLPAGALAEAYYVVPTG